MSDAIGQGEVVPPKWVVFDIGRVLVEWNPDRLYRELIPDDDARAAFFERTSIAAMNVEADRNGDLQGKVAALSAAYPQDAHLITPWWDRWLEMCHAPIAETGAFLARLKRDGVPTCALSNFADDTFAIARERYTALKEFDAEVISGREGLIKPDPRIYALVEERTGAAGLDLFFMDDSPANVDAALARGWRAHLFTGWTGLAADLPNVGLGRYA